MYHSTDIDQQQLLSYLKPRMQAEGQLYQKKKNVYARPVREGEEVVSFTSSGQETDNVAREGDYLVRNQTEAGEVYLVSGDKFSDRYDYLGPAEAGFSEYRSRGKVYGLAIDQQLLDDLKLPDPFHYEAPWESRAFAQKGDFLAMPPDYSEVYRIGRQEFFETYQIIDNPS